MKERADEEKMHPDRAYHPRNPYIILPYSLHNANQPTNQRICLHAEEEDEINVIVCCLLGFKIATYITNNADKN